MYAVHIRNLSPTRGLSNRVPYEVWTGHKPDVSHLRVFGSVAYVNIPKKVHGGKLEATLRKCRLLGWWADETKGYRLEDEENRRLITSRDVCFLEDEGPNDLVVIESSGSIRAADQQLEDPAATQTPPELKNNISNLHSLHDPDLFLAQPPRPDTPPDLSKGPDDIQAIPALVPAPEPSPPKTSRWADLPQREPSTRVRNPVDRLVGGSSGNPKLDVEIEEARNQRGQHRAFIVLDHEDPRTFKEAMNSPHAKDWEEAQRVEVKQLEDTEMIRWVKREDIPEGKSIISSKNVWKTKRDGEGNVTKRKNRIVARGFSQVPGEDFDNTFASTARFTTLRCLISIAAREGWELHQFDVNGTYLKGELDEELYMEVPEGVNIEGRESSAW